MKRETHSILRPVLLDIARSQDLDLLETPERLKAGPNDWDNIQPSDFGPEHDYSVTALHDARWAIYCVSKAALEWCHAKLPEDCPRWCDKGFIIEDRYLDFIEGCMSDARLMSEQDYTDAMEEANALATQWEDW